MQLLDLFDLSLVGRRDRTALLVEDGHGRLLTLTFGEVDERSSRMARLLGSMGFTAGDRLAVHLANRLEYIDLYLACVRLGLVFVPVNVLYWGREIAHIMADAGPRAAVTTTEGASRFPAGTRVLEVDALASQAASLDPTRVRVALDGQTPALLAYTSGTTGRSKGAVLTHDNLATNASNLVTCWRITESDRYLAVLPLFHVHGLANGLHAWLLSGCTMRLVDRFVSAAVADLFESFRPTLFFGVPTIYVRLLEQSAGVARRMGSHMRLFVSGSAPLPARVLGAFKEAFGHTILERYGMTEALMLIANPLEGERRAGSVGLPLPGVVVRVVGPDGDPVADDEVGELLVRGPTVFSGYWRNPEATAAAFRDGFFATGDLASRAPDGTFTIHGRSRDLIISGGFNIYPREVEDVLLELPGVLEAAVVGVPDERRGEVPVAYVVADRPLDSASMDAACRRQIASFKVPRAFVRVDALPRTALGKVQKHLLPPPPDDVRVAPSPGDPGSTAR